MCHKVKPVAPVKFFDYPVFEIKEKPQQALAGRGGDGLDENIRFWQ